MKSLKARGALIVEYALLLAVCCILGVVFLDAAPQVRDGVDNILQSTDKVLVDANDKIKGDKPGEEGDKPSLPEENPNFANQNVSFIKSNGANDTQPLSNVVTHYKNALWTDLGNAMPNGYVDTGKYGQKDEISMISWAADGTTTVTMRNGQVMDSVKLDYNSGQIKNDAVNNFGIKPGTSGAIVFDSNGNLVQHNEDKSVYTYLTVGDNQVGYKAK